MRAKGTLVVEAGGVGYEVNLPGYVEHSAPRPRAGLGDRAVHPLPPPGAGHPAQALRVQQPARAGVLRGPDAGQGRGADAGAQHLLRPRWARWRAPSPTGTPRPSPRSKAWARRWPRRSSRNCSSGRRSTPCCRRLTPEVTAAHGLDDVTGGGAERAHHPARPLPHRGQGDDRRRDEAQALHHHRGGTVRRGVPRGPRMAAMHARRCRGAAIAPTREHAERDGSHAEQPAR